MSEDALKVQKKLEKGYIEEIKEIDNAANELYKNDVWKAREYLTDYSLKSALNTFDTWKSLSQYLLVKYIDGNIKKEKDGKFERSPEGYPAYPDQPGYPDSWKKSVIEDTGDKLLIVGDGGH